VHTTPNANARQETQEGEPIEGPPAGIVDNGTQKPSNTRFVAKAQALTPCVAQVQGAAIQHRIELHSNCAQEFQCVTVGADQKVLAVVIGLSLVLRGARASTRLVGRFIELDLPACKAGVDCSTQTRPARPHDVKSGLGGGGHAGLSEARSGEGGVEGLLHKSGDWGARLKASPGLARAKRAKTFSTA
jgi:hypothetical protein